MTSAGRNLLVITNSFPDKDDKHVGGIFVKDQLRELSSHFDNVYVVFPSTLGMGHEPKEDFRDYSFGNVKVFFLGYFNVPLFLKVFRGGFTYLMARAVDGLIRRRGLKFDLIHAHFTWPSGAAAARLKEKVKAGLIRMAQLSGAKIFPVYISFSRACMIFSSCWRFLAAASLTLETS